MTLSYPFTITNETVSLTINGKTGVLQREGNAGLFQLAVNAILAGDWNTAQRLTHPSQHIQDWLVDFPKFSVQGGMLFYGDKQVDSKLYARILSLIDAGGDPSRLFKFFESLDRNPSYRSVRSLFNFLQLKNIPIDADGMIVAYKSVRPDLYDHWTGKIQNLPGSTIRMDRNEVSDDPDVACHAGLHLGSSTYAEGYHSGTSTILLCRVAPENVVSVPNDHNCEKMRTCKYEVLGVWNGELLPSEVGSGLDYVQRKVAPPLAAPAEPTAAAEPNGPMSADLNSMTIATLRGLARAEGIKNPNSILGGKKVLIDLILKARGK